MLTAAYPAARVTVGGLDRDGVDFCAREFGAEALHSEEGLANVDVGRQFDLIWCRSLFAYLLRLIGVQEHGWAGHQDMFSCQRLRTAYPTRCTLSR